MNTLNPSILLKDFRYWNDPGDEFRFPVGVLLPLWVGFTFYPFESYESEF